MNDFQERVGVGQRSRIGLRQQGSARTTAITREEGHSRGEQAGSTTEHWDGRVDSAVTPAPVKLTVSRSKRQIVDVVG